MIGPLARSPMAVILASIDARPTVRASVEGWLRAIDGRGEVIVVDASRDGTGDEIEARFPGVRLLRRLPGRLAPELWRDGLEATDAPLVAFSTTQMVPSRGWRTAILDCLEATGAAGAGGPIEPASDLRPVDRAVYLLRYVPYLRPLNRWYPPRIEPEAGPHPARPHPGPLPGGEGARNADPLSPRERAGVMVRRAISGFVSTVAPRFNRPETSPLNPASIEPPGDNAVYRRDRLAGLESLWKSGFWEVEIHRALRARGERLDMADGAVVSFQGGTRLAPMLGQRFAHARQYGASRAIRIGVAGRMARLAATPAVPP